MTTTHREDSWTAAWVAKKIDACDGIERVLITGSNSIEVALESGKIVRVATMALQTISASDLDTLVGSNDIDFVINVPANPKIEEDVLPFAQTRHFAVGGMGDFMRAIRLEDPATYAPPQVAFVMRGLRQHSAVESVERLDANRYRLKGRHWPTFVMIDLDEYELTAETLRHALDESAPFDFVLASNPNRGPTSAALEVAKYAGKKLFVWKELLGALNKPWT